jgi:DNA-binding LacI/PurR family transcriptional regulator
MKRPTLRDVAESARVSHMTVSRVLRATGDVAPQTAEKVAMAIEKLGYRPDPVLSALAAYRSGDGGKSHGNPLAFLDCDGTPYSQAVLHGVRDEAGLLGYSVESFRLAPQRSMQEKLSRILFHRGVRGLLFGPSNDTWKFDGWKWEEFAAVSLNSLDHHPAMHAVAMDYFHGAVQGVGILARQGCKRIGFVVEPKFETRTGHRWLGGYLASLGANRWVYPDGNFQHARLRAWVGRRKIDGILTIHPEVVRTLRDSVIRFAFLHEFPNSSNIQYPIFDPGTIGTEGVRLIHHLLLRHELGIPVSRKMISLQGVWQNASE